jgi:hypothetical protein
MQFPQFQSVAHSKSWIIETCIEVQNPDFKANIRKRFLSPLNWRGRSEHSVVMQYIPWLVQLLYNGLQIC